MDPSQAAATQIGKREGLFAATKWTVVLAAKGDSTQALNSLCGTYRAPLIAWLRSRGEKPENAEDSVQGFFEHLLGRKGLQNVAREKGRFRTFLLTAFQNYLHDERRRLNAAKRGGGQPVASLDETKEEGHQFDPAAPEPTPDLAYDQAWAEAVLANALELLERECDKTGHGLLCAAL